MRIFILVLCRHDCPHGSIFCAFFSSAFFHSLLVGPYCFFRPLNFLLSRGHFLPLLFSLYLALNSLFANFIAFCIGFSPKFLVANGVKFYCIFYRSKASLESFCCFFTLCYKFSSITNCIFWSHISLQGRQNIDRLIFQCSNTLLSNFKQCKTTSNKFHRTAKWTKSIGNCIDGIQNLS